MAKYSYWLTEEGIALAAGWARNGLTDEQIAHNMGISRKTLYQWCKKYKSIGDAIKKNKEMADLAVENALYKAAIGYEIEEEIQERVWDSEAKSYKLLPARKKKRYIPPSQTAQIFWLKNRRPDLWRDKQEIAVEDNSALGAVILPGKNGEPEYENSLETTAETS